MTTDQEMRERTNQLDKARGDRYAEYDAIAAWDNFEAVTPTWVPGALDRFDRLRELHQPSEFIMLVDANNPDVKAPACRTCLQKSWPCETRRIIDEEGDDQ